MGTKETIRRTARKSGLTQEQTQKILKALTEVISESLEKGQEVAIQNFGRFYTKPYKGRRIKTVQGIYTDTMDKRIPSFKASENLKKRCNQTV